MVLKQSCQRRLVVRCHRLINFRGESRIVGHEKGEADGLLEELEGSFVCAIRRRNLKGR